MAPSLKEASAVAALAESLYSFLPGSSNSSWKGHITFATVAQKVGVREHWPSGSKKPALRALLEGVLVHRRERFEPLVLAIVREGLSYRRKSEPVTATEIKRINGHILEIGFKFPELWDPAFLASLEVDPHAAAEARAEAVSQNESRASDRQHRARELLRLNDALYALMDDEDRSRAGLALERILNELFALFQLAPRNPFRVTGEQIDGSFDLHREIYLLEAKWLKKPVAEAALLVFRGKIEAKSNATRGVFIALNGISSEAKAAITRGKQPNFFVMDGYDLSMILGGHIALDDFLYQRQRILAEEGEVSVPFSKLKNRGRVRGNVGE